MAMGRDTESYGAAAAHDVGSRKKRPRVSGGGMRLEQVKRACEPCRRSKLKCQSSLPCSQCISRGIEQCCVPSGETGRLSLADSDTARCNPRVKVELSPSVQQAPGDEVLSALPMGELGWRREDLRKYMQGLTPEVRSSVTTGLKHIMRAREENLETRQLSRADSKASISRGVSESVIEGSLEQEFWSGHPTIGVFQVTYDPASGTPVEIYINQRFATILGYPQRQDCLACIAANNLPLTVPNVDMTFMILKDLENPDSLMDECPLRLLVEGTPTCLRTQRQKVFNSAGCLVRTTHFWELVSHTKWAALRDKYWRSGGAPRSPTQANSRGGSTSPAGSVQGGDMSYPDHMISCSVAELQSHPEGARVLERLCEVGDDVLRAQRGEDSGEGGGRGLTATDPVTQVPSTASSGRDGTQVKTGDPRGTPQGAPPAAAAANPQQQQQLQQAQPAPFSGPDWGETHVPLAMIGAGGNAPTSAPFGILFDVQETATAWDRSKAQGQSPYWGMAGQDQCVAAHAQQQLQSVQHGASDVQQQKPRQNPFMHDASHPLKATSSWGDWGDATQVSNILQFDPFGPLGMWQVGSTAPPPVFDTPSLNPPAESQGGTRQVSSLQKVPSSRNLEKLLNLSNP